MTTKITELVASVRSGVIHIEFHLNGRRVASGSGFMARGLLVTNHHVFLGPQDAMVVLGWQPDQDVASRQEIRLPYRSFASCLVTGAEENSFDFAILNIPALKESALHQFEVVLPSSKHIGDQILILGFPLEHQNLVAHVGFISSFYRSGLANVIQLDASVNQSNSGGPLLDIGTGQVLGIVTRKGTGLSRAFDELLAVFDKNIAVMTAASAGGSVKLMGIDPLGALIAGQNQMKSLAKEIIRSANVGIGYAFSSEHILSDAAFA